MKEVDLSWPLKDSCGLICGEEERRGIPGRGRALTKTCRVAGRTGRRRAWLEFKIHDRERVDRLGVDRLRESLECLARG